MQAELGQENLLRMVIDEWDDIALQKQDSKFESWRSDAEHATSRSPRIHIILNHYEWAGKKISLFETWRP